MQVFLTKVLNHKSYPIGQINDFFYRVEFQQRGSPHIHMLIWIKDAPKLDCDSKNDVVAFVDKYITCRKDATIGDLVNYQTHRHAVTCRKKGKSVCRFGFPLPPMDKTCILEGLDQKQKCSDAAKKNYSKVMTYLESLKLADCSSTFSEFLSEVRLSYDEYISALRSSIKPGMTKIFLKRSLSEIRVNNYNTTLLKCWEANLDIQFILDPYACAAYIASYISKGQRGMSNLLGRACREAREVGSDIKAQVRKVGNVFLNHVEIGAQEAVYLVLQLPLRRASRQVVYINTRPPEERVALIKSADSLKDLPRSSTSIEADNDIKRYQRRPPTMEKYSLADFIACFEIKYPTKKCTKNLNDYSDDLPENVYEEDTDDGEVTVNDSEFHEISHDSDSLNSQCLEEHVGRDGSIITRRSKPRVTCSVGYNIVQDRENYFRELIMLYTNWRNEHALLGSAYKSYEQMFDKCKGTIECNMQKYVNKYAKDIAELTVDDVQFDENIVVSAENQHQNEQDTLEGLSTSELFQCFDPGKPHDYDLAQDFGLARKQVEQVEVVQNIMCDEEYRHTVQCLNRKQKQYFYHVLHWHKTTNKPMYSFLSGGAGVGKSVLLRAVCQSLKKFYGHQVGENPDACKVLVCAPTGKAAYNVAGLTIHSAFNIPAEQGFNYKPLDMQQLGTFQGKYGSLKVLIIDEMSMVGQRMFHFINQRLQEIMGNILPFGGVSVLAFGDLFQLKPVMDRWIFSNANTSHTLDILATNLWLELFTIFELDQIMRQKDDIYFAQLLNRLREGNHTESDLASLREKILPDNVQAVSSLPHLYTKREEVENHNKAVFNRCSEGEKTVVTALDSLSGDFSRPLKQKILSKIPEDSNKTKSLSKYLHIAEKVPAELCCNIDVLDGLTNGTPCLVMKLDFRVPNSPRCSIIWVKFEEHSIGLKMRDAYKHLYNRDVRPNWTPILEITKKFQFNYYKSFLVTRRQFPLTLAAAKTVHKAQGSTMSEAVIHLGKKKNDHMHYVALSRVQNLSNVKIIALNEHNISVSDVVLDEMLRMRETALIQFCLPQTIKHSSDTGISIIFQNCRSLSKHIGDIRLESFVSEADVLAFSETRLRRSMGSDQYHIPGCRMWRHDQENPNNELSYHGTAIYTRADLKQFTKHIYQNIEITTGTVYCSEFEVQLCIVYCPPKYATLGNLTSLFTSLTTLLELYKPFIIMGDFNYNISKKFDMPEFLKPMPCAKQLISQITTDYYSLLDHIYTNIPADCIISSGVLESYYSDHKPVFLSIKL